LDRRATQASRSLRPAVRTGRPPALLMMTSLVARVMVAPVERQLRRGARWRSSGR
jgi:hypothetical protein